MKLFFVFVQCTLYSFCIFSEIDTFAQNFKIGTADPIFANDDVAKSFQNSPNDIPVLSNDFGLADGVKSLSITKQPKFGTVVVLPNNLLRYTPNNEFVGFDNLEYTVCGNSNGCDAAVVTIEVMDFNYTPVITNDTIVVLNQYSTKFEFDILKNDKYIYDKPLTVSIISELVNGTTRVNSNSTITPKFNNHFIGNDTLTYIVVDAEGDRDTAMVFFEVRSGTDHSSMLIPNGISPNGDGLNDIFTIPDLDAYQHLHIQIFSQWGQMVFDREEYQNNWDGISNTGTMKGKALPSGTYYYILSIEGADKKITGYIYISR